MWLQAAIPAPVAIPSAAAALAPSLAQGLGEDAGPFDPSLHVEFDDDEDEESPRAQPKTPVGRAAPKARMQASTEVHVPSCRCLLLHYVGGASTGRYLDALAPSDSALPAAGAQGKPS